jgi:Xaa-Pro dipeptidase
MFHSVRLAKLIDVLKERGLDAIFLAPSSDMEYLTGMRLHPDSRFKGVMVSKEGKAFSLCPSLYKAEMSQNLPEAQLCEWKDGEGFRNAFLQGCTALGLMKGKVAFNGGVRAADMLDATVDTSIRCVNGATLLSSLRRCKDAEERELLRRASKKNDSMMEKLSHFIRPGKTEREIAKFVMGVHEEQGGLPRYPIVGSGPNGAKPHYSGEENRTIQEHDVVVVDSGAWYESYNCDMTRTFIMGSPSAEVRKVYDTVLRAQNAGQAAARLGAIPEDIDRAARSIIEQEGYGEAFFHRLGHGTGRDPHEEPFIVQGNRVPLQEGNCFSIEPGIYLAGRFGVRIENLVLISEKGTEILNSFTKSMIIIE